MDDLSLHHLTLFTYGRKPLLEGELRRWVEQCFKTLPGRYPGLKLVRQAVHADRVEMVLDLHRLDEDLPRIVQSFKTEARVLARKNGFDFPSLWEWSYEEKEASSF